jgi:hypothetical protein
MAFRLLQDGINGIIGFSGNGVKNNGPERQEKNKLCLLLIA